MRSQLLLLVTFCICKISLAQDVEEVIRTERSFAQYAVDHNTRDAFLQFMDSNAVVFNNGKASSAKKVWTANRADSNKLVWTPAFAGISFSGDLGFTTGPWEFKRSLHDTALASGEYATVWKKTASGEWKFLVDMGIVFQLSAYPPASVVIAQSTVRSFPKESFPPFRFEQDFISDYARRGKLAVAKVAADKVWINFAGYHPFAGKQNIQSALAVFPPRVAFTPIAGSISSSNDMAYVYGTAKYDGKEENYLRVWQRTSRGWKILLQVLK